MAKRKSPSNPIHERNTHDWARRVIAKHLGIDNTFMKKDEQWHEIVTYIINREAHLGTSI